MPGRSCRCLLALSFLILPPAALRAQSGQINPAPNYALPLSLGHPTDGDQTPPLSPPRPGLPRPVPGFPPSFSPITPPVTVGFPLIARAAGTIFSGTVTAVARHPPTRGQAVETVEITFHIENAIRGATSGQSLTISQWLGLWSAGQRYRVGERVLLFLYPPSKLGLTSCVGGNVGRFAIDPWGRVQLSAQHLAAFRADPVLGGKSRLRFSDFALAVRRAAEEN
jgi:hypothetical protein